MEARLKVLFKNIPDQLKKYNQWVGWDYESKEDGKGYTKVPKNILGNYIASSKEPRTWVDYPTCFKHHKNFDGIGFVVSENDPFVFWDFDKCIDPSGEITSEVMEIVTQLNSYTEVSPSGKGLRVIVIGEIIKYGRRNNLRHIECYDSKHYLTLTGHHLPGTPKVIKKRFDITDKLHREIFKKQIEGACRNKAERRCFFSQDPRIPNLFGEKSVISRAKYC